jgi:sulfite reductase alpha subunit
MNEEAIAAYAKKIDIQKDVVELCPSKCMSWNGKKLAIDNSECVRCMHCINVMPKALRPGKDKGAALLLGSKAPIVQGAQLSSMMIPFLKMEPPYDDVKEFIDAIFDLWAEEGKNRERVGEFIQRVGMGNFLETIGLEPIPEMIAHPRDNPYIFFESEDEEEEE